MKKFLLVLLIFSTISCLILLLLAYPRFTDDKELIFTAREIDLKKSFNRDLFQIARDQSKNLEFNDCLRIEIEKASENISLVNLGLILSTITRLQEEGSNVPSKWTQKDYLNSLLYQALEHEIYIVKTQLDNDTFLFPGSDPDSSKEKLSKLMLSIAKFFTFQKNRTLNQLWIEFKKVENELQFELDISEFGYPNFYGKSILALAIPPTTSLRKRIEEICANKTLEEIPSTAR